MATIFNGSVYGGSPGISTTVNYEYVRDGANMKYHFWGNTRLSNSNGWYYNNVRVKLYLNGSDIYTKDCKSSSKGWSINWDAGWHTVSNKTSGTTPFYFTVKDTQNSGWCNYTSGTYQLDVAPAYTSITGFSVGALSETSVRFNWSAANTVDYVWYSINNGSSWTGVDVADGTSGSFDVGGLAANTGYNFKIRVRRGDSQLTTDSGAYYAATYAYPYLTSVPEFTVGNSLIIGIYNPLGRSCTISVIGDNGVEHNGGTITGTSISPFNNDSWKNIWYSTLPSKTQGTYKVRLVCATGNVNQVSSAVKYYLDTSDSGFKPSFTANEIINVVNTANTAIAGSNKFIKNHNSLSGVIKPMTAKRYASGSYYNVSASGLSTVKKDYSSSNINFVLGNMSTNTFNVTAVDSRGFTTTASKTIDLVDYNNPGVTTSKITRQNGIGTKAVLDFTGVYTNWAGLLKTNSIQSIRYKIGASGTWKSLPSNTTLTSSNGVWTLNAVLDDTFATTSQYDLYLEIKDLLETVVVGAYTISTADAFIWKDLANKRMGINKKPDYTLDVNGTLGINGLATFKGKVDISGSADDSPLMVRGIVGRESSSRTLSDLHLQYQTNYMVKWGKEALGQLENNGGINAQSFKQKGTTCDITRVNKLGSCSVNYNEDFIIPAQSSAWAHIKMNYNHTIYNSNTALFTPTSGGIKVNVAGYYLCSCTINVDGSDMSAMLYKDNTNMIICDTGSTGGMVNCQVPPYLQYFNAGEILYAYYRSSSTDSKLSRGLRSCLTIEAVGF